jgi:hypothetical protein
VCIGQGRQCDTAWAAFETLNYSCDPYSPIEAKHVKMERNQRHSQTIYDLLHAAGLNLGTAKPSNKSQNHNPFALSQKQGTLRYDILDDSAHCDNLKYILHFIKCKAHFK